MPISELLAYNAEVETVLKEANKKKPGN